MHYSQQQVKKVEKQGFRKERRHTARNGFVKKNTSLMSGVQDTCHIRFNIMATSNSHNKKKMLTEIVKCTEPTKTTKPMKLTTAATPVTAKLTTHKVAPPTKKVTRSAVISELIKLKSQQKFLECSQVKLNTENFKDADEAESKEMSTPIYSQQAAWNLIHEIERLKGKFDTEFLNYRRSAQHEVQDIVQLVNEFKKDILQPQRFMVTSMNTIRQRIIDINVRFERLINKNSNELQFLQSEYERLQNDKKILVNFSVD